MLFRSHAALSRPRSRVRTPSLPQNKKVYGNEAFHRLFCLYTPLFTKLYIALAIFYKNKKDSMLAAYLPPIFQQICQILQNSEKRAHLILIYPLFQYGNSSTASQIRVFLSSLAIINESMYLAKQKRDGASLLSILMIRRH